MKVVRGFQKVPSSLAPSVVAIGNFDGVHLGHQKIIHLAVEKAKNWSCQSAVYTFRPHPQSVLKPDRPIQLISSYDEKLEVFGQLGVDLVVEEPFDLNFSKIEPEKFFSDSILNKLNAKGVVVGYDFAFGKERHGHLSLLEELCKKASVELAVVPAFSLGGENVSSTKIRQYLNAGEIEKANSLLGRPFSYRGSVVTGDGRGRKIGFPTANLQPENKMLVPYGVYATETCLDGKLYPSVTNIGIRPTFGSQAVLIETHLLNVSLDLYGKQIQVQLIRRLRGEKKFNSIDELKAQIALDIQQASQLR